MLIFRSTGVCRYLRLLNRASCFLLIPVSISLLLKNSWQEKKKQIKANLKKMNHAIIKGAFTSQDPRHWSENTPSESGPFDWCVSTSVSKQGSVLLCWVLCLLLLLWVYWRMANQLGEYSYIHMCTRVLNDMWGWEEGGQIHCNKYIIIYFLATWQHQREAGHNISSSFKLTWRIYSKAYSFFTQPAVMKQR